MDRKLLLLINQQWTSPALDRFMALLSSFDAWAPLLLVAALVFAWRGSFRVRSCLLVAALAAGLSDGLVCSSLKRLVDRPRPNEALAGVRMVDLGKATPRLLALAKPLKIKDSKVSSNPGGRSFPSSHTVNTTVVAVVIGLFFARLAWLGLLVPVAVGYSRIYTGSHWPSDIAGSLLLGGALALGVAWASAALWAHWARRFAPCWFPAREPLFSLR